MEDNNDSGSTTITNDITTNMTNPCDEFRTNPYIIISGVRALFAFFSFICCILVIILIILFKRYNYFIQRLVLYVCIIAAINSITIITQKADYFMPDQQQEEILGKYCIFAGFLEFYTSLVELMMLLCITHGLYHSVVKQRPKKYLEGMYILSSCLFPVILACMPFFGLTYGKSGPWCWIKDRDDDCKKELFGISLQFVLWYCPLVVVTVLTIAAYIATLCKVRRSIDSHWQGPYDPELFIHRGRLRKIVTVMFTYLPVLYLIVNLFALPNAIHWAISDRPELALWVLNGIFPPLRGALFAVPYLVHKDTRKQLKQVNLRAAITQRVLKKHKITSYPAKECNFSDSLTFPAGADTTVERLKPYRNPSLRAHEDPAASSLDARNRDSNTNEDLETSSMKTVSTIATSMSCYLENGNSQQ